MENGDVASDGTVVGAYGGFYFVRLDESGGVVACRSRGKVRFAAQVAQRVLLVGDRVRAVVHGGDGVVETALPRRSELLRPPVANVDLAVVVVAAANPSPNLLFTDRLLVSVERAGIGAIVCINKVDLAEPAAAAELARYTRSAGYQTHLTSAKTMQGLDELRAALANRTSTFAGASGVGKSALVNAVVPGSFRHTGSVSQKLGRGRHTTRHTELLPVPQGGFVADTPGFTALELTAMAPRDLTSYFPDLAPHAAACRFVGCLHDKEPDCGVKRAVAAGAILDERYRHYLILLAEAKEQRLW